MTTAHNQQQHSVPKQPTYPLAACLAEHLRYHAHKQPAMTQKYWLPLLHKWLRVLLGDCQGWASTANKQRSWLWNPVCWLRVSLMYLCISDPAVTCMTCSRFGYPWSFLSPGREVVMSCRLGWSSIRQFAFVDWTFADAQKATDLVAVLDVLASEDSGSKMQLNLTWPLFWICWVMPSLLDDCTLNPYLFLEMLPTRSASKFGFLEKQLLLKFYSVLV